MRHQRRALHFGMTTPISWEAAFEAVLGTDGGASLVAWCVVADAWASTWFNWGDSDASDLLLRLWAWPSSVFTLNERGASCFSRTMAEFTSSGG